MSTAAMCSRGLMSPVGARDGAMTASSTGSAGESSSRRPLAGRKPKREFSSNAGVTKSWARALERRFAAAIIMKDWSKHFDESAGAQYRSMS